jgi:hypothetical protein
MTQGHGQEVFLIFFASVSTLILLATLVRSGIILRKINTLCWDEER